MSADVARQMPPVTHTAACPTCGHRRLQRAVGPPVESAQLPLPFRGHLRLVVANSTRDVLILSARDLVERLAGKIGRRLPPHISRDELVSVGMVGLVQAADRFDPARGFSFRKFASSRIYGAIMDDLRSRSILKRRGLEKARRGEAQAFEHPLAEERGDDGDRQVGADQGVHLPPVAATQLDALLASEAVAVLFERIPARDARLIRAIYLDGESEEDIAQRCGAKVADVRRQAERAMDALRAMAGRG